MIALIPGELDTRIRLRALWAWESIALFVLCMADMASTLYWVHRNEATEANPYMEMALRHGDWAFCLVKLCSFLPLLAICACLRPRRPRLIAYALRGTLVLYVLIYASAMLRQALGGSL